MNNLEEKLNFANNTIMEIYSNANDVRVVKLTTNDKPKREFHKKFYYGTSLKAALKNAEKDDVIELETGSDTSDSFLDLMLTKGFKIRIYADRLNNLHFNIQSKNDAIVYATDPYKTNLRGHFATAEDWAKEVLDTLGYSLNQAAVSDVKTGYNRTMMYQVYSENVNKNNK